MELHDRTVLVTGGAGLVGSALVDRLVTDNDVTVVDDLSYGERDRVHEDATFVEGDVRDPDLVAGVLTEDTDIVFHLAAISDVDYPDDRELVERNTAMTYTLLERAETVGLDGFLFTSSSTVYGEAPRPTPEDYGPLEPISEYGVAKLADEGLVSTYANSYGVQSWVVRFANIVGPGQRGNVVPDFVEKLLEDPERLEILGDGRQEKSYMHVSDCVAAIEHVVEHAAEPYNVYNLGTHTTTSVDRIAAIVAEELGVDPTHEYTGGDRGWVGDVPRMRLDIQKLTDLGFEPALESDAAVRRGTQELIPELRAEMGLD
jgi:UDP-glucose 4-epimerase